MSENRANEIEYAALCLKRGEDQRLRAGHAWVFSNEVDVKKTPLSAFAPGEPVSGVLTYYVIPNGIHGFDEVVYPVDATFDTSQYVINLIGHYAATDGTDLLYHTDPAGHACLETSTCAFLSRE